MLNLLTDWHDNLQKAASINLRRNPEGLTLVELYDRFSVLCKPISPKKYGIWPQIDHGLFILRLDHLIYIVMLFDRKAAAFSQISAC